MKTTSYRRALWANAVEALARGFRRGRSLAEGIRDAAVYLHCAARTRPGTRIPVGEPTSCSHLGQTTWNANERHQADEVDA